MYKNYTKEYILEAYMNNMKSGGQNMATTKTLTEIIGEELKFTTT